MESKPDAGAERKNACTKEQSAPVEGHCAPTEGQCAGKEGQCARTDRNTLAEAVRSLAAGSSPMHMPGHKRRGFPGAGDSVLDGIRSLDITEIYGADDLHRASGILKEAMDRTACLSGAERTWYLVNGSTVGILAAVHAAVPAGGEIIAARNCHKSVVHAIGLRNLRVRWAVPEAVPGFGIAGPADPAEIERLLEQYPRSSAVILTSPSYEGVLTDISAAAAVCHRRGKALIVDEAHGAHLGLDRSGFFPDGAVHGGADLVIQSAHKLSLGLTQTAFLHMNSCAAEHGIRAEAIESALDLYETSSPSYPLMISMDEATALFAEHGEEIYARWREGILRFRECCSSGSGLRRLKLLMPGDFIVPGSGTPAVPGPENAAVPASGIHRTPDPVILDPSKLVISTEDAGISASALAGLLRTRYAFEPEMAVGNLLVAITGPGDDPETLARFGRALREIDGGLTEKEPTQRGGRPVPVETGNSPERDIREAVRSLIPNPGEAVHTIGEALGMPARSERLVNAEGGILAEYLWAYPPGIPLGVPGERVTGELIRAVLGLETSGTEVLRTGNIDKSGDGCVLLLCCG